LSPRELGAAVGELGVLGGELVAAGGERRGAAGELVEIQQRGLVGVEQADAFAVGLVDLALDRGQLCGDQVVVVERDGGDDRALAGEQLRGLQQGAADLVKDVGVEVVGADVAFGAAVLFGFSRRTRCARRLFVDDRRDRDENPFRAWALAVARLGAPRAAAAGAPWIVSRRL